MREDELQADALPEAVTHERDEPLDPAHQICEEAFTLRVDLVYKAVEGLLVPLDEIHVDLDSLRRIRLTNYGVCSALAW